MVRFLLLLMAIISFNLSAHARDEIQLIEPRDILYVPVLYDGRVMPLDSFADIAFQKISGKQSKDSGALLMHTLFMPETAMSLKIFKIENAARYKLDSKTLYNFRDVSKIIDSNKKTIDQLLLLPQKQLSLEQKNLIDLYANTLLYNQLLRAMTGVIPLEIEGLDNPTSYYDLAIKNPSLPQKHLETKLIAAAANNNILFRVIPINTDKTDFISPWQAIRTMESSQTNASYLKQWQELAMAYRAQDDSEWNNAVKNLRAATSTPQSATFRVTLEKTYNDLSLVNASLILFVLALGLLVINEFKQYKIFLKSSRFMLSLGSVAITADIVMRVIITARPPVGTLYESILFVCVIIALGCTLYAIKKINHTALWMGSISGVILLLTAKSFVGIDSFSPLVAVLNTDFWLATHVIIITAGYGFCLIASFYAHVIMITQNYNKKHAPYKNLNVLVILSLLFVTVGTILGGLWADQSWGRFWGWDPKENGAMLIMLWIIWLLHGKITHDLPIKYYMAGIAYLSVIVALAWFGVNLLSVGLHSYGFISGIAWSLGSFCTLQTLILVYLIYFHKKDVQHEN